MNLVFRGLPQKVTQQHYGFGGRVDLSFDSYALNSEELDLIKKEMDEQDIEDGLKVLDENTQVALDELKEDLKDILDEEEKEEKQEKEKKQEDINPFAALFSFWKTDEKKKDKKEITDPKEIKKDNFVEEGVRLIARDTAKSRLYTIYDIYKKAHGMASSPEDFDNGEQ